jgi:hypothetical protein
MGKIYLYIILGAKSRCQNTAPPRREQLREYRVYRANATDSDNSPQQTCGWKRSVPQIMQCFLDDLSALFSRRIFLHHGKYASKNILDFQRVQKKSDSF